jgi:hypothetical protein
MKETERHGDTERQRKIERKIEKNRDTKRER